MSSRREVSLIEKGSSYTIPKESDSIVVAVGWEGLRVYRFSIALLSFIFSFLCVYSFYNYYPFLLDNISSYIGHNLDTNVVISSLVSLFISIFVYLKGLKIEREIDLDLGVVVFDKNKTFCGWCNYENGHLSYGDHVVYSGDDREGSSSLLFNEAMWIKPKDGFHYAVLLNSFSGDKFSDIVNGLVALFNADFGERVENPARHTVENVEQGNKSQLIVNNLNEFGYNTETVLLGTLSKIGNQWVYRVHNKTYNFGKTCSDNRIVNLVSKEI